MKKIVMCVSIGDDALDLFNSLKSSPILSDAEVHLVHSFETQVYSGEFFVGTFPGADQYEEIEKSLLEILNNLGKELGDNVLTKAKCIFSTDSKESMKEYLKEVNADLAIIATRGKHGIDGFFSSSFAEYMVRYSPCDIHILRPSK